MSCALTLLFSTAVVLLKAKLFCLELNHLAKSVMLNSITFVAFTMSGNNSIAS